MSTGRVLSKLPVAALVLGTMPALAENYHPDPKMFPGGYNLTWADLMAPGGGPGARLPFCFGTYCVIPPPGDNGGNGGTGGGGGGGGQPGDDPGGGHGVSGVPEPGTMLTVGTLLAAFAWRLRRMHC